jgi:rRNA-processing protein FCF1
LRHFATCRDQTYEKVDLSRKDSVKTIQPLAVLLDTSFLLMMLEQRRDIEEELRDLIRGPLRIATLDMVERELQRIGRTRSSKTGAFANAAVELLKVRKYSIFPAGIETSDTDAAILSFSLTRADLLAVATVDGKLRASLSRLGIATIFPKRHQGLLMSKPVRPSST